MTEFENRLAENASNLISGIRNFLGTSGSLTEIAKIPRMTIIRCQELEEELQDLVDKIVVEGGL